MAVDYKDYYKILGLPKTATEKEIKSAYRKLARQHHPDVNSGDKKAEDKFKDIGEAYDVLSDADKRTKYDQYGDQWKAVSQGGYGGGGSVRSSGQPGGGYAEADFGGAGGIDDFLASLFGGAGPGGHSAGGFGGFSRGGRPEARSQQDVEYPIEITLAEAYGGAVRSFTVALPEVCGRCNGAGAVSAGQNKPCAMCGGTGRTKGGRGFFGNNTCPQCGGTGQAMEVCPECHGDGQVTKNKKLSDVKIPAGVSDGQRIRLAGQGAGGGDLYLKVKVKTDPRFEREGDDLYTDFDVPYTVAALGGEAGVETFAGRKTLNVPAGTQSGQKFRLTGQGLPNLKSKGATKGNLFARARLTVPKDLSPREKEMMTELAKLRHDTIAVGG